MTKGSDKKLQAKRTEYDNAQLIPQPRFQKIQNMAKKNT